MVETLPHLLLSRPLALVGFMGCGKSTVGKEHGET